LITYIGLSVVVSILQAIVLTQKHNIISIIIGAISVFIFIM